MFRLMVIDPTYLPGGESIVPGSETLQDRYYGPLNECLERTDASLFPSAQNYEGWAVYTRDDEGWVLYAHSRPPEIGC